MSAKDIELTGVKEIARRANVSIGTVDRVIHDRKECHKIQKTRLTQLLKSLITSLTSWQEGWLLKAGYFCCVDSKDLTGNKLLGGATSWY